MKKIGGWKWSMARGDWGNNGRCSYKKTTLIVCFLNIIAALYVLHFLYSSLYAYPSIDYHTSKPIEHTVIQIRRMEESNRIRKASEPTELIKLFKKKFESEERLEEVPQHLKHKFINEILDRLRSLEAPANTTELQEAIESWRKEKLKEAKKLIHGQVRASTILSEEASAVKIALSSRWALLLEEIGLWIPAEIIHKEHDDKPEDEDDYEDEILPGKKPPSECNVELHTDYGGSAVRWGLTHHQDSAHDCCMACLDQAKHAKPGEAKCNVWVYCPSENGCYSPDIYEHKNQECWLKYSEAPKPNFKDVYPQWYQDAHPNAPIIVPWVSGVVHR